jgi:hypothetical protein
MGAKPKKTSSAAKGSAGKRGQAKRAPARRTPARKAAGKTTKSNGGKTVEAYVAGLRGWQRDAAQQLRALVRAAAPNATESFKWGQPIYEQNGPFCYFKSSADHITFGFWRGTELNDPDWKLEGDGDRMKHLKIRSADDVNEAALGGFVRQAVELNQRLGSPTIAAKAKAAASAPTPDQAAPETPLVVEPQQPAAIPGDDGWHEDSFQQ